jgi:hypothetical protein
VKTFDRVCSGDQVPLKPPGTLINSTATFRAPCSAGVSVFSSAPEAPMREVADGSLGAFDELRTAPTRPSRISPVTTTRSPGSAARTVGRSGIACPPLSRLYLVVDRPVRMLSATVARSVPERVIAAEAGEQSPRAKTQITPAKAVRSQPEPRGRSGHLHFLGLLSGVEITSAAPQHVQAHAPPGLVNVRFCSEEL